MGSTTSVDDSYATAGGTVSQLVVSVAAELALGKVTCFNVLILKLCRVLLDSKVLVEEISDGEAHPARRRWRSEGSGENSRKGKKGASASLHVERLSRAAELKRRKSEEAGSDDPLRVGGMFDLLYPEPSFYRSIASVAMTTSVPSPALLHRLLQARWQAMSSDLTYMPISTSSISSSASLSWTVLVYRRRHPMTTPDPFTLTSDCLVPVRRFK